MNFIFNFSLIHFVIFNFILTYFAYFIFMTRCLFLLHLLSKMMNEDVAEKMALTCELSQILYKIEHLFGDLEPLVSKNLTPIGFWFIIDAQYFQRVTRHDFESKKQAYMKDMKVNVEDLSEAQEQELILKIRKLVSKQKGTLNISDILSTSIDEAIEAAEENCARLSYENSKKYQLMSEEMERQNIGLQKLFMKFEKIPPHSHPMFLYDEIEEGICEQWIQEEAEKDKLEKCYICSRPSKLISCKTCTLKVHESCYPVFPSRDPKVISKQENKRLRENLKNFQCQNCKNDIDQFSQICCLCCCIGGSFLKTCLLESEPIVNIEEDQNTETHNTKITTHIDFSLKKRQMKRNKYVHVSCFIWNTEAKWNPNILMVEGISKIDKKKMNGMCSLCGVSYGAAIPCSNQSCRRFYHGECGRRNKLEMNLIRAKTSVIELYCERHRHLKRYESIHENHTNKMRDARKLFEGMDKEIKRQHSSSELSQLKNFAEKDICSTCGKEESFEKVTVCKQCRKWFHNACSTYCQNCLL